MPIQTLTPQEIQVLQELGLNPNSIDLEKQIQEILEVATVTDGQNADGQGQNVNNGDPEPPLQTELFASTQEDFVPNKPLEFSAEAKAVFEAGQELWRYYFKKVTPRQASPATPHEGNFSVSNPSLYDIKAYFQGVDTKGRMNNKSEDEEYNRLIANLRQVLEVLAAKIQPKVYEYGFLR